MKIINYEIVEGCIEGKNVYDAVLSEEIDEDFINYLSKLGKMIYIKDIPIPYFRIIVRAKYTMKGNLGKSELRIILPDNTGFEYLDEINNYVFQYNFRENE